MDIPEGYEIVSSPTTLGNKDIPEGYEVVSAPTTAQKIAAQQFPTSPLQILSQMRESPQVRDTGLGIRAALQGVSAPVTLGSDLIGLGINKLVDRQVIPSLGGMVSDTLTNIGIPEPKTTGERLFTDVASGAMGGGSIAKGALPMLVGGAAGGGSGLAREMGASPLAQFVTGIGTGIATGGIGGALKALTTKPVGAVPSIMGNLEKQGIDELSSFGNVRTALQDESAKQQGRIGELFTKAEEQGKNAYLPSNSLNEFAQNLREQGAREASKIRSDLFANTANKLENMTQGHNGLNAQGMLDYKKPSLNDIEMIRRSLSAISKNRDAEGNAAGQLVSQIDGYLNNNIADITGDKKALGVWQDAIRTRREYAQKFENPKDIAASLADNSPEVIEQKFIGSGGASLNKQLSTTYKNTLKALPEDQRDQAGFLLRQSIVNRMVKNAAQSSDSADGISAQRLSNQIRNFRRDNQSMWENFTPEEKTVMETLESDLREKTKGGVLNTVAKHLFSFMSKATRSNLELPRTMKPKTIITVDDLLDMTKQKPEGFGVSLKKGALNPSSMIGSEAGLYQQNN